MLYRDRTDAGKRLAIKLQAYANRSDVLVLALPRGGVLVAFQVAEALNAPLDIYLVRKLGVPGHKELAMGAIASGGVRVINDDVVNYLGISGETIDRVAEEETEELSRRDHLYRGGKIRPELSGRTIILIDDGLATGSSMRAAVQALKQANPAKIVIAVPVAPSSTCEGFKTEVDEIICLETPEPFQAIGLWYRNFSQTTDEEVKELLERAAQRTERKAATKGVS
ncbi:MAG: phosphoribosyltransferase [Acidobacteriota bacterium]